MIRLPQYCPPVPACQHARLAGGTCPPMGLLEPAVCKPGYFCPPGGEEQIICPAGSFCSVGAIAPTPCSVGARCAEGSIKNQTLLPFILLLLFDFALVLALIGIKVSAHWKMKHSGPGNSLESSLRKAITFIDKKRRTKQYHSLEDKTEVAFGARIAHVQQRNTGFHEALEEDYTYNMSFEENDKPNSDLQLFVQSLSKCIEATKFGLSFGFEDLSFHPNKTSKPILSEVTGYIDHGTLWGVMGASGAGKCMELDPAALDAV